MHHLETKHDEVASDMRREQSKQRNEANDVNESADERQGRRSEHDPANRFPGNTGLFMICPRPDIALLDPALQLAFD